MDKNSRWLFTKEQIINSPSRKYNIDYEKEIKYRHSVSGFIQDLGQSLKLTQLCINTAIVYMHRFYMFHSMTKFDKYKIGMACLYLSAKTEETPQRIDTVINKAYRFLYKKEGPPTPSPERYSKMYEELLSHENILLMTLGFDVRINHPHLIMIKACELIKANKELKVTSYFLASNSLHLTTMCLEYRPSIVACLCIYFASKWSCYEIPLSALGKPWFSYIDPDVTLEFLDSLTNDFLHVFEQCHTKLKRTIQTLSGIKPRVNYNPKLLNNPNHLKQLKEEAELKENNEREKEQQSLGLCLSKPHAILSPQSLFSKEELAKLQEPIRLEEKQLLEIEQIKHNNNEKNLENERQKRKLPSEENYPEKRFCISSQTEQALKMRINISTILKSSLNQETLNSTDVTVPATVSTTEFVSNPPEIKVECNQIKQELTINNQSELNSIEQSNEIQFSNNLTIKEEIFPNCEMTVKNLVPLNSNQVTTTVDSEKESDVYINVTDITDTIVDNPITVSKYDDNNNEEYEKKQKSKKSKKEKTERKKKKEKRQKKEQKQEEHCDTKINDNNNLSATRPMTPIIISIPKEKLNLSDNLIFSGNKLKSSRENSLKIKIPKKLILDTKLDSPSTSETVQASLSLQISRDIHERNTNEITWMTQHRMQTVSNGY